MSCLIASVLKIESCDSLHIVKFDFVGQILTMMSLELDEKIQLGIKVKLSIKPTAIAIAKDFNGVFSDSNQIKTTIKSIQNGKLLSSITLKTIDGSLLESIITKDSAINLKSTDEVIAMIKASDISISEIIDV